MKTAQDRTETINRLLHELPSSSLLEEMKRQNKEGWFINELPFSDAIDNLALISLRAAYNARIRVDEKKCFYYFPSMEKAERSIAYDIYKKDLTKDDFIITNLAE